MSGLDLLELLSDGQFRSGVELAGHLGVSRTTVWNQLNELKAKGVKLESVRGKGYRVVCGVRPLREQELNSALSVSDDNEKINFKVVQCIDSTNTCLVESSVNWGDNTYFVLAAESQTNGRGRRGKSWFSPFAKNIYFSLGFIFSGNIEKLEGLSVVVGVILADVLTEHGVDGVKLKWPNDIYISGKKLGGILIELTGELNSRCAVVIGVGLNVDIVVEDASVIDQPWTSLRLEGYEVDRTDLLLLFVSRLICGVKAFLSREASSYIERWARYDYLHGKTVELLGRGVVGVAVGIKDNGCLILDVKGREYIVNAGEVSVRLSDG